MKIHYMSDLHLEFGALEQTLPKGDVLILDGDITLVGALDPEDDLYYSLPQVRERTSDFLDEARTKFKRIFYVIGNHEAYNYSLSRTPRVIRKRLKGVELLNDTIAHLSDDVVLVGGTLWTDMNNGKAHGFIGGGFRARMNDFNIVWVDHRGQSRKFTTHDAVRRHRRTLIDINNAALSNPGKTIVVATHHAPSFKGINPEHGGDALNAGYASDLEGFIARYPNIKFWVHGHTHIQTEYQVAQCRVMANCRGYAWREACASTFDPDRWFSVAAVAGSTLEAAE